MITEELLEDNFRLADEGKKIWEDMSVRYNADLYILFPHDKEEYNYYALLHLDQYIKSKKAETVVFLFSDAVIENVVPLFSEHKILFERMTEHEVEAFIKYYALFEFTSRLTIISLTRPYDTCGENLLGVKGVTKEDLVCFDMFRFNETPFKDRPVYTGNDKDIEKFMHLPDYVTDDRKKEFITAYYLYHEIMKEGIDRKQNIGIFGIDDMSLILTALFFENHFFNIFVYSTDANRISQTNKIAKYYEQIITILDDNDGLPLLGKFADTSESAVAIENSGNGRLLNFIIDEATPYEKIFLLHGPDTDSDPNFNFNLGSPMYSREVTVKGLPAEEINCKEKQTEINSLNFMLKRKSLIETVLDY